MTWIATLDYADADDRVRALYDRIKSPDDVVDNIMAAHSLRPHTMEGHMALYKRVLHHTGNTIPRWFLEALGVYTSLINSCGYCVDHHHVGMTRALGDPDRAARIRTALDERRPDAAFPPREAAALDYARRLTETPASLTERDIDALRRHGWSDGEILEINQVVAYFSYANRTVLGLGVDTRGDVLGLSPNATDDPTDWHHRS